jgi:pimeloyl-ACP methyl ester carboxylesterase
MTHRQPQHCITRAEDGQEVHYDHYRFGHKKAVIIAHGFFNSKEAVLLKSLGEAHHDQYDVIIMDFRGHGKSKGLFYWTTKEPMDLEAVLRQAAQEYERLGVIGFSLGGAISLIVASRTSLMHSLISVSAPVEFEKIDYRFWELDIETDIVYNLIGDGRIGKGVRPGPFWLKKEKPAQVAPKIAIPVFYIHGEADWLIKPWHAEVLFDKTSALKKMLLVKNGPHAEYLLKENAEGTIQAIRSWWQETL